MPGALPIALIAAQLVAGECGRRLGIQRDDVDDEDVRAEDWRNAERAAWSRVQSTGGAKVQQGYSWQEIAVAIANLKMEADDEARAARRAADSSG